MTKVSKRMIIIGLCIALAVAALAGPAYAYFTQFVSASGEKPVTLGYGTETHEELDGLDKKITITNNGETEVMVRVRLFGAYDHTGATVSVGTGEGAGGSWSLTEGEGENQLWTYNAVLQPGETSVPLVVDVEFDPERNGYGTIEQDLIDFDIIVVSQTSPVAYKNGEPYAYNWSEGGNE